MKYFFRIILVVMLLVIGCVSALKRNYHKGWSRQEFQRLSADNRQFDLTYIMFRYHEDCSKMVRKGNNLPMSFPPYAYAINYPKLVKSIRENYGVNVSLKEFLNARDENVKPVKNGKWLEWAWQGSFNRNRAGMAISVFAAEENGRPVTLLDMNIYLIKKTGEKGQKILSTDNNNIRIGNTSGLTAIDIIRGIKQHSYVKKHINGGNLAANNR